MGRKAKTRSSKKQTEAVPEEENTATGSIGFGLSNLTAHDDTAVVEHVKVKLNAGKSTRKKSKSKKQVKRAIRKPSPKKGIKSILKTSKRTTNDGKPSESMLLLLGGESAKKAKQAKSMINQSSDEKQTKAKTSKAKQSKRAVNQKVKAQKKAK